MRSIPMASHVNETPGKALDCEEIARLAYELYEQRSRENGWASDDWLQAEAMLRRRCATGNARRARAGTSRSAP